MKASIPRRKMQKEKVIILTRFQLPVTVWDDNCLLCISLSLPLHKRSGAQSLPRHGTQVNSLQSRTKQNEAICSCIPFRGTLWDFFSLKGLRGKNHGTWATGYDYRAAVYRRINSIWLISRPLEKDHMNLSDANSSTFHLSPTVDANHWLVPWLPFNCS